MVSRRKIQAELLRLLVYYLGERGASAHLIRKALNAPRSTIRNWYHSQRLPPTRFFPQFEERIRQAAEAVVEGKLGCKEAYKLLLKEAPKNREKPKGYCIDPSYLHKGCVKVYAAALDGLLRKMSNGHQVNVYHYSPRMRGNYPAIIGSFFMLPPEVLPGRMRGCSEKRAYLAVSYDKRREIVFFYDEDGNAFEVPITVRPVREYSEPVPVGRQEISDLCASFFRRRHYDPSKSVELQVGRDAYGYNRSHPPISSGHLSVPHKVPHNICLEDCL